MDLTKVLKFTARPISQEEINENFRIHSEIDILFILLELCRQTH